MMLNQLVSNVVNWAQTPLDQQQQQQQDQEDPSSPSSMLSVVGPRSGRSCSTASAPSPSYLRASRSLQRNCSLRKSFKPFGGGSSNRQSPLSRYT